MCASRLPNATLDFHPVAQACLRYSTRPKIQVPYVPLDLIHIRAGRATAHASMCNSVLTLFRCEALVLPGDL